MASSQVSLGVTYPLSSSSAGVLPPAVAVIHEREFMHDMCVLTYYAQSNWNSTKFSNGSPVTVTYGYSPNKLATFYGYVHHIIPLNEDGNYIMRVVCIGASYPLKDVAASSLPNITMLQSAELALQQNNFSLVVDPNSTAWPSLTRTANETLWQYLVRLAKMVGCTAFMNATTMYIYDPADVLLANVASYPTLNFKDSGSGDRANLISFKPSVGADGTGELENKEYVTQGIDPLTKQLISASGSAIPGQTLGPVSLKPQWTEYLQGAPASNRAIAQATATGMAKQKRWVNSAIAVASGNVRTTQGTGVIVRGTNGTTDGLWYVSGVEHTFSSDDHPSYWTYNMKMKLLRDSEELNAAPAAAGRPVRKLVSVVQQQANRRPLPPLLVNGRWVAQQPGLQTVAV